MGCFIKWVVDRRCCQGRDSSGRRLWWFPLSPLVRALLVARWGGSSVRCVGWTQVGLVQHASCVHHTHSVSDRSKLCSVDPKRLPRHSSAVRLIDVPKMQRCARRRTLCPFCNDVPAVERCAREHRSIRDTTISWTPLAGDLRTLCPKTGRLANCESCEWLVWD